MKKFILLLCISTCVFTANAQQVAKEKEQQQSNAEKFGSRAGTLIQREYIEVGTMKRCKIQLARFSDLITGQKSSAVRFEFESVSSLGSDTKLALLDTDEIEGLVTSLTLIQDKILPNDPTHYTEVSFKSRSGFEAGCFKSKNSWSVYMKLEPYDSRSYVFMEKEDLPKLLSLIDQTKAKL